MAWRCHGRTNTELITNLYKSKLITTSRVKEAMLTVDRAHYCPLSPQQAYDDRPQSLGYNATISAPHMHASAAEALEPLIPANSGKKVLDVGSGSGYLTHVLAQLVCGVDGNGEGKVVGIEHIPELVEMSRLNIVKSEQGTKLLESGKVEFVLGDGRLGFAAAGPYDAIHVGAAAAELHDVLVEQLNCPGRLFIPVEDGESAGWGGGNQWIWVVDKDVNGKVTKRKDIGVRYVPLTDAPRKS